ncbi:MAG: hypothetical protein AB7O49_15115 [Sphingomonadales bacterium]
MKRTINIPERVLVLTFLVASCAVRLIGLSRYSFDPDEIFTVNAAQAGWGEMLGLVARDVSHPPLFYGLLKLWLGFGPPTEGFVRLLPAMLGAAAFVPFLAACRRLKLEPGALAVALALFTANAVLIQYAQYARMFALLQFAGTLSVAAFLALLDRPERRTFWLLTAANVLAVHAHYWGWMVVLAELLAVLLLRRDLLRRYAASLAIVAAAFAPWAVAVALAAHGKGSATAQIDWMGAPDWRSVAWLFGNLSGAPSIPHGTAIGLALFAVPLAFLAWRMARERSVQPAVLLLLAAAPVVATLLLGWATGQPVWGERHLIVVAVPYFLLVAAATTSVPWPRVRSGMQVVLMAWATLAGAQFLAMPNRMLQWEQLVDGMIEPGRPVAIRAAEPWLRDPIAYFAGRNGAPGVTVTMDADPARSPPGDRFWFVYRDTTWASEKSPVQLLRAAGFEVESMLAITTPNQRVVALKVRRAADARVL